MVEPGGAPARPRVAVLVEQEDRLGAVAEDRERLPVLVHAEPKRPLVPGDGAREVGDVEMDGSEAQRGGQHGCGSGAHLSMVPDDHRPIPAGAARCRRGRSQPIAV